MARSLRFWLALGLTTLIGIAVAVFVATLLGVLLPRLNAEVEAKNRQLGQAIAGQVSSFLTGSAAQVVNLGEELKAQIELDGNETRLRLDTLVNAVPQIDVIYLVDAADRVADVGLALGRRAYRGGLLGVDFSSRTFVRDARVKGRTTWSDSYLSSRGRIVVAVAVPLSRHALFGTPEAWTLVAELDLAEMSQRAAELGKSAGVLPVIVDRRGNIVAHPDPQRGLRQDNIAQLPPVQSGLDGRFETSRFRFDGTDFVGTGTPVGGPGWLALVAQPVDTAYATVHSTLGSLFLGAAFALVLALISAFVYGRRLTARVADFSRHVQAVADGDYTAPLPRSRSEELDRLAHSMRRMADAVLQREAALREGEAKYRGVVETTRDLITRVDAEGRFTFVNHMADTYLGLPPAACVGRLAFDFVHPDDRAATEMAFKTWLETGGDAAIEFENRQVADDGRIHLMHWSIVADRAGAAEAGTIVGFSSIARDVTAERAAEQQIAASEARYRSMFQQAPLAYQSLDLNAVIVDVNDAWLRLLGGYTRDQVIGRPITEFISESSLPTLAENFPAFVAAGKIDGPVFELRRRDGETRTVVINGRIVHDAAGDARTQCILTDITERLRAEEAQRLAATVFSASAEGICITDADRRIVSVNPALTAITGYSDEELIGQTPKVFSSGRHDSEFYAAMWERISMHGVWRGEIWNRRKDGEIYPEWLTIAAVKDGAGQVSHYIGSFFDISERKQSEEHIRFLAHHDALTKLPNRTLLDDRIRQAIAKSRRNEDFTAVLFLDLDRFKLINDTLGHDIGDRLLAAVADRLQGELRETETVARLGGDEFIIVIPELPDIERVAVVARKVLEVIAAPQAIDGRLLHVTPSIGISVFPNDGDDASTLLRNADTAMYHAKERGRNNFQFFTPAMNLAVQERVAIENDLRQALEREEFLLYYQPQVDCRSGEIVGMEALIRWRHPERGLVPPDRFISIAEETGLIVPIGTWVLREACRQARRWHDAGHAGLRIGVNLSARQFEQADLYEQISAALADSGIDPTTLELELTESMLMADPAAAIDLLNTLAALGIGMAIDDFGTGYSSLAYLKRFPVTRLKIDRSFVRDLSTDPNDAAIVSAIVAMASSLKMEVIAEGVETVEQLDYLAQHGCHEIQGYLFSRPRPADEFAEFRFPKPGAA